MKRRVSFICSLHNEYVSLEKGEKRCQKCAKDPFFGVSKQTIRVDGPTLMATDDPMFKRDPNDPLKRRIVPSKAAWKRHLTESERTYGHRREDIS